jgi:hypothetical protein
MAAPEHRPSWVRADLLLGEHGMQEDTPTSRAQFEQWMERRRLEETDPEALKSELAQLHARGRCRQRWPGATGHMTNGATRNDPSYGLPPVFGSSEYTADGKGRPGTGKPDPPKHTIYRGRPRPKDPRYSGVQGIFGVSCFRLQRLGSSVGFGTGTRMAPKNNLRALRVTCRERARLPPRA